jgi:hypothetical protein
MDAENRTSDIFGLQRREIKELKGQKKRLENMLFVLGKMNDAPCFVCGYKGEGYYQPDKHRCAARHHKLFKD